MFLRLIGLTSSLLSLPEFNCKCCVEYILFVSGNTIFFRRDCKFYSLFVGLNTVYLSRRIQFICTSCNVLTEWKFSFRIDLFDILINSYLSATLNSFDYKWRHAALGCSTLQLKTETSSDIASALALLAGISGERGVAGRQFLFLVHLF